MKTMNRSALSAVLLLAASQGFAQETIKVEQTNNAVQLVTLRARGVDVRFVLHDLFDQAKQSYILEGVPFFDLYLSLDKLEFEEALSLILRASKLTYERENGIFVIRKAGDGSRTPKASAPSPTPTATTPTRPTPVTTNTPPATGRLPQSVLNRRVKGSYTKRPLAEIVSDLGQQAGVRVEVDPKVPKYALDFTVNETSLGWSLRRIAQELRLELVFSENQSLLLRPRAK